MTEIRGEGLDIRKGSSAAIVKEPLKVTAAGFGASITTATGAPANLAFGLQTLIYRMFNVDFLWVAVERMQMSASHVDRTRHAYPSEALGYIHGVIVIYSGVPKVHMRTQYNDATTLVLKGRLV